MKSLVLLIRHAESLKNAVGSYSSLDGKEPLTLQGLYQVKAMADCAASIHNSFAIRRPIVLSAGDIRSYETAQSIAQRVAAECVVCEELSPFTEPFTAGQLIHEVHKSNTALGEATALYRAGLISGYEVPWPAGSLKELDNTIRKFIRCRKILDNEMTVVVGHKSVLTCLAINLLKSFKRYPQNHYGYIDIPVGTGVLMVVDKQLQEIQMRIFKPLEHTKKEGTDVCLVDGKIIFPESACAVCVENNAILLVKQRRGSETTWELPGGKVNISETPVEAALRELNEEAGFTAGRGMIINPIDLDLSVSIHRTYLIAAEDIRRHEMSSQFEAHWVQLERAESMLHNMEITHAPTIIAVMHAIYKQWR